MAESEDKQQPQGILALIRPIGLAALMVVLVYAMMGQNQLLAKGEEAPALHLTSYDGQAWSLDQFKGKVTVVNFWATWCPPCMAELPVFAKISKERADDVVFVGVAVSSPQGEVFDTIRRIGIRYPIAYSDAHALEDWHAATLPTTYVLDAQHRLVYSARGQLSGRELNNALDDVLGID